MRRGGTGRETARWDTGREGERDDRGRRAEEWPDERLDERRADPRRPRRAPRDRPADAGRGRREAPPDDGDAGAGRAPLGAAEAARTAARYIRDMTGKEPDQIIGLERTDGGGWRIDVQAVETRRIPDSTDILAVYETELDAEGELVSYRRTRRFSRCQIQEGTT
jgi:hypothetical protein